MSATRTYNNKIKLWDRTSKPIPYEKLKKIMYDEAIIGIGISGLHGKIFHTEPYGVLIIKEYNGNIHSYKVGEHEFWEAEECVSKRISRIKKPKIDYRPRRKR